MQEDNERKPKLSIYLNPESKNILKRYAQLRRISMNACIEEFIDYRLVEEIPQLEEQEKFRREKYG